MADLLFVPVLLAYVAIVLALFVYGVNFLYLTFVAVRARRGRHWAPDLTEWPTVTVQLPIYNEMYVAARLIDKVAALDYPRDRLDIQVLDDSTDETESIVAERVAHWRDRGVPIRCLRRTRRDGYKAGALRLGMASSTSELLAVFDADFLPTADFLRRTVPVLCADPGLAFVQARWGHVNRDSSLLTRMQALAIDGHFGIEQTGRSATGSCFNFNGTAGVWRRAAIESAGGWHADTLTEDLDLSYRAFLAGWRAAYLPDVEAPAELPVSMAAFRRQQHRWARGSLECAAKHVPAVWHSSMTLRHKLSATLHLSGYVIHLLLLSLSLLYPVLVLTAQQHDGPMGVMRVFTLFNVTTLAPILMFTIGQHLVGRRAWRQLPSVILLSVFGSGLMVNTARAGVQAAKREPAAFERTPKFGMRERRQDWPGLHYQLGLDRIIYVELALAALNVATCVLAVRDGFWTVAVYSAIFAVGLAGVALASLHQAWRTARTRRRAGVATAPAEAVLGTVGD